MWPHFSCQIAFWFGHFLYRWRNWGIIGPHPSHTAAEWQQPDPRMSDCSFIALFLRPKPLSVPNSMWHFPVFRASSHHPHSHLMNCSSGIILPLDSWQHGGPEDEDAVCYSGCSVEEPEHQPRSPDKYLEFTEMTADISRLFQIRH